MQILCSKCRVPGYKMIVRRRHSANLYLFVRHSSYGGKRIQHYQGVISKGRAWGRIIPLEELESSKIGVVAK